MALSIEELKKTESKFKSVGIWTTELVDELLKFYEETGRMPRNNPFMENDLKRRKPFLNFELTNDEFLEQAKSMDNVLFFGQKYAKVMTDAGYKAIELRPYQSNALKQFNKFRLNVMLSSRQSGKCVTFDTTIHIFDEVKGVMYQLPIYELYYNLKKKNLSTVVEFYLYKLASFFKSRYLNHQFGESIMIPDRIVISAE